MAANGLPRFTLPKVSEGVNFGPPTEQVTNKDDSFPTISFNKSDRLGMIVDWSADKVTSGPSAYARRNFNIANPNANTSSTGDGAPTIASTFGVGLGDEDDASFSLVDGGTRQTQRRPAGTMGRGGFRGRGGAGAKWGPRQAAAGAGGRGGAARAAGGAGRRGGAGGFGNWSRRDWNDRQRTRIASVGVAEDWELLEDIDLSRLQKLRLEVDTEDIETISSHGFLYEYDKTFDRVSTRNDKPLQLVDRLRYNPTASDDPILQEFAENNRAQVFTTDLVLSTLMCSVRSVFPWDIVITREGGKLFMDKREYGPFQFLSVNENAADPPLDNNESNPMNSQPALSQEATYLNDVFMWQCVREGPDSQHDLGNPNPFYSEEETEPLASCGYLYRSFDLSASEEENIDLLVRTEVDAQTEGQNLSIKTLFEFDSKSQGSGGAPDWRSKLDSQRGSIIATEMKNNSFKFARWAVQSVLAGIGQMKVGYISRANPRDQKRHTILGTQTFKTKDLITQMSVNLSNGWGIVRAIIDFCMAQPDGKYVLMKDPNKPVLRLYKVPADAFAYAEDEEIEGADELHDDL